MSRLISDKKTFVIAEMANSHEGDILLAKKITKAASDAGANGIKYQKFLADELAETTHENYSLYKKLEMNPKKWEELISYAKSLRLKVFVDIFGLKSAKFISQLNIDGYKIHSSDVSNPYILNYFSNSKKLIFLSTAGCYLNEIDEALRILSKSKKEIILLHGFQGYPTALDDLNLLRIPSLIEKFDLPVGLMDHISGDSKMAKISPLIAISLGAKVIEKHITLDRTKKGLDYYSALEPNEFKELIKLIRLTEKSFGNSSFDLVKNEYNYRKIHKKNPISKKTIIKNTKLNYRMFNFLRTKDKLDSPLFLNFENYQSSQDIKNGTPLTENKIKTISPKIAAVIACRVNSSRLYGKPLQLIGENSILELLLNQLKTSKKINEIVLAISENPGNDFFIDFARERGIRYIIGNDADVLDRLIKGAQYVNADIVFRITSDCPFIYWEGIDEAINAHIKGKFDFSVIDKIPLGSGFEIINRKTLQISHKQGQKKHRSELCSLYILENRKKFRINKKKPEKILQRPEIRLTVDTPQDLWLSRIIHNKLGNKGNPIKLKRIIQFLDSNPKISQINSNIPIGKSRIW